jgi:hypothetical protein
MSLQLDFNESGLKAEEYIRTIWGETELTEDALLDVDPGYLDQGDIEHALYSVINDSQATQARKDFYRRLVIDYVNQENGAVFGEYCRIVENLEGNESSKREMLASIFTRVLRGELAMSEQHRLPSEANMILAHHGVNPWQARLDKLIALEHGLIH